VASNDCITDTMRYSVWRAGLLFCIGFESNGNHDVEEYMDGRDMETGANIQGGIRKQLEQIHQVCKNNIFHR